MGVRRAEFILKSGVMRGSGRSRVGGRARAHAEVVLGGRRYTREGRHTAVSPLSSSLHLAHGSYAVRYSTVLYSYEYRYRYQYE